MLNFNRTVIGALAIVMIAATLACGGCPRTWQESIAERIRNSHAEHGATVFACYEAYRAGRSLSLTPPMTLERAEAVRASIIGPTLESLGCPTGDFPEAPLSLETACHN